MEWEYKIINQTGLSLADREKELCELGKEGWMISAIDSPVIYLIRQKEYDDSIDEPYYR